MPSNNLIRVFKASLETMTGANAARRQAEERENAARRDTLRTAAEKTRNFGGSMAELTETLIELRYAQNEDADILTHAVKALSAASTALDKASNRV